MIHEWIQQNHDGLPQKAGLPQHCINEIHGAWFDPSNPVVSMSGHLRCDLSERLNVWKKKADLVLALGTSLAAVGADEIVEEANKKQKQVKGLGAVIISLQRTYYDDVSSLRIFGKLDEVLGKLAKYMNLQVDTLEECIENMARMDPTYVIEDDVFSIPYDPNTGELRDDGARVLWDLRKDALVEIKYGPGSGFQGKIVGKTDQGHYLVEFPRIVAHNDEWIFRRDLKRYPDEDPRAPRVYTMGSWWAKSAMSGDVDRIPFVSIHTQAEHGDNVA
jgi:hypothetical protein